ncbi:MAG: uroporphyrinogen decarboxylase family protein [Kiritimatiellae bacterium]|nr:uroporphyrinogen decarboxylase family protein [Kiritimatiellia bacterium]MDD5521731.1 uroporphyrinogen decarboxylase family protein [Kiritimatiellia bacterium]
MAKIKASDFFDLDKYHKRVGRNKKTWSRFLAGEPVTPVFMNLCAPALCELFKVDMLSYYTDLSVMAEVQLRGIAWRLENLDEDELPEAVFLDQATVHEALVFNAKITYSDNSPPWGGHFFENADQIRNLKKIDWNNHAALKETNKKLLAMRDLVEGLPVLTSIHMHAPFTMAAQLYGAENLYVLCYEDPELVHKLLNYCVETFIEFDQIKGKHGIDFQPLDEFVSWRDEHRALSRIWVSDDSSPMVSPQIYTDFVFPYNSRLFSRQQFVHLHMDSCWDHLIPFVSDLKPKWVEVGGETSWDKVVVALGKTAVLQGGILCSTARDGSVDDCVRQANEKLEIARGRARVVITIANEVHPGTSLDNMQAIIRAVKTFC